MNRRKFLTNTTACMALGSKAFASPNIFRGVIKKAVKFGTKPNEQEMQQIKNLGFDGIEGSAPGLQVKEMKKPALGSIFLCMAWFIISTGRLDFQIPIQRFARKVDWDLLRP